MKPIVTPSATLDKITEFTHRYPSACFHTIDMPYRLCSPAAQDPANCKLWMDESGEVLGFGLTQLPFSSLDWAVRPGNEALQTEIVAWGVERLQEIAHQRGEGFGYLLDSRTDNDPIAQEHGFVLDDWHIRNLDLSFDQPAQSASTPSGFHIRPLYGDAEVAAYVALHRAAFDTRNMSVEWRARTLSHPTYQPQLDLVAEAANGRLAAFCIGWLGEINGEVVGQIEPVGVLPEFQRQGLGRAILRHSLQRFYKLGAKRVLIDAESHNLSSKHLYEASGFREATTTYKYFRQF
jgi:mycothiol synthase